MRIAELEAREDVRLPMTIHWNTAGEVGDDRHRRQLHPPGRARVEQVDRPRLQRQPARARPRHGAALPDQRRPGAAALRLAGQLAARQPAGADVVAARRSRRTSTSGSGRTARSAGPRRRGRSTRIGIDEKTFMDDLYRAFDDRAQVILQRLDTQAVGPARRRHRVDRPRAAHDVAAASIRRIRCTTRRSRRSSATRSSASTAGATTSSAR